ncbi:hypothetical protein, partial [Xanthovirga aplysinae]|uniref:hypothetical protein n=1 Tax=Xanthovirga aplysinae TaxID=2529853 RepID=UPI001656A2E9
TEGGRMLHNDDLQIMQDELFIALEEQYRELGPFIFSGCAIKPGSDLDTYNIDSGLVYINGRILQFHGNKQNTSAAAFNSLYLQEAPATPQEYYVLRSGARAPKRVLYEAELVNVPPPEGEYIKFTLEGGRTYPDALRGAFKALSIGHATDDFGGHSTLDVLGNMKVSGLSQFGGDIKSNGDIRFDIIKNESSKGIIWSGVSDTHSIFVEEVGNNESTNLVIYNADNGPDGTIIRNRWGSQATPVDIANFKNSGVTIKPSLTVEGNLRTSGLADFEGNMRINNLTSGNFWPFAITTAGKSNNSGFWTNSDSVALYLRDSEGNLNVMLRSDEDSQLTHGLVIGGNLSVQGLSTFNQPLKASMGEHYVIAELENDEGGFRLLANHDGYDWYQTKQNMKLSGWAGNTLDELNIRSRESVFYGSVEIGRELKVMETARFEGSVETTLLGANLVNADALNVVGNTSINQNLEVTGTITEGGSRVFNTGYLGGTQSGQNYDLNTMTGIKSNY